MNSPVTSVLGAGHIDEQSLCDLLFSARNWSQSSLGSFPTASINKRNFCGRGFTQPPFAGHSNGVVVYSPYLMDQYCGMLLPIWWH